MSNWECLPQIKEILSIKECLNNNIEFMSCFEDINKDPKSLHSLSKICNKYLLCSSYKF